MRDTRSDASNDDELAAMGKVAAALSSLDQAAIGRVLNWANSRYKTIPETGPRESTRQPSEDARHEEFTDFPALFDAADPQGEQDKALVAAYWFQVGRGLTDLDSQSLNTELKNMGHGVGNITRALSRLQNKKPVLIRQVQKSGTSKQARKRYRVTTEGIRAVQRMLSGAGSEDYEERP